MSANNSVEITLHYFAMHQELAACSQEQLAVNPGTSVKQVYQLLVDRYGFNNDTQRLRAAINEEFADWSQPLKHGDQLAFIPPVSGG